MDSSVAHFDVVNGAVSSVPRNWTQAQQEAANSNPQAEDCYYYFYSTCNKGSECKYRHCSVALGSEQVCELWRVSGSCSKSVCAFRHTAGLRQRSIIPCYWESQPQGCQKSHCPFLHTKPRPQPKNALHRLEDFRMSSIKIKSVDELKKERQLKEAQEKIKEDETKLQTLQKELDIRQELMKRILAERESFKKRQEKACEESKMGEKAEVVKGKNSSSDKVSSGLPSSDYISLVATKDKVGDASNKKRPRPTNLDITSPNKKKTMSDVAQERLNMSRKKLKLLQDRSAKSGPSRKRSKQVEKSSSSSRSASKTATKIPSRNKIASSNLIKPSSPPSNSNDFKIKTLEELKKERMTSSEPSKPAELKAGTSKKKIEGDRSYGRSKSIPTSIGRKKVILLRHRRPSEVQSSSDRDSEDISDDQRKPSRKASNDNPLLSQTTSAAIPTSTASTTTTSSTKKSFSHVYSNSIPATNSQSRVDPIPTSKSEYKLHSIPESTPISVAATDCESRRDQAGNSRHNSPPRKRKVSLVRKGRRPPAGRSHDQREEPAVGTSEEEDVDVMLDSAIITEAISITDLKNELFCDIEDTVPTIEDHALLEEMAQLEDDLLEEDNNVVEKDNPLTHSRSNDDELLLQMEELM